MPRIQAPTVAQHHARQRRAVLDAARELLAETGEEPSMREVGERVGLARSSVYQYFTSAEELLGAVVADVFPSWAEQITRAVAAAQSPALRVWAYIESNLDLFASPEQSVAATLSRVVDPQVLSGPIEEFHARLQEPLHEALEALGEPEPAAMGALINALIIQASRDFDGCAPEARDSLRARALERVRRLVGGYLSLPTTWAAD